MDLLSSLFPCFPASIGSKQPDNLAEPLTKSPSRPQTEEELTSSLLALLFTTEKHGSDLDDQVNSLISTSSWTSSLAARILDALIKALDAGTAMSGAMKEAFDKASAGAAKLVEEHPVLTGVVVTIVALAILYLLVPWVIEALGFAALGPVEGSWAAAWQSSIGDVIEGSWFAWFQKLGMKGLGA